MSIAVVVALPQCALWLQARWLDVHAASYGPLFALLGTWAFGALAALLGHPWPAPRVAGRT